MFQSINIIRSSHKTLFRILLLIQLVLLLIFTACDEGDDNPVDNGTRSLPPLDASTLLVADASTPVWFPNGETFLCSPKESIPGANIYLFDITNLEQRELFNSDFFHKYDYSVSPEGDKIAVSTPERNGGVYVINISSGEAELVFANGQHPSWSSDGEWIYAERQGGGLSAIEIETGNIEEIYDIGLYPEASPDGSLISFLLPSQEDGFRLVTMTPDINASPRETGLEMLSTKYLWGSDSQSLIVARHSSDRSTTSVIRGFLNNPDNLQTIFNNATSPSLGGVQGNVVASIILEESRVRGVVVVDLSNGEKSTTSGDVYAVAVSPVSNQILVETELGIHLLE